MFQREYCSVCFLPSPFYTSLTHSEDGSWYTLFTASSRVKQVRRSMPQETSAITQPGSKFPNNSSAKGGQASLSRESNSHPGKHCLPRQAFGQEVLSTVLWLCFCKLSSVTINKQTKQIYAGLVEWLSRWKWLSICHQAKQSEFDPQGSHGRRRDFVLWPPHFHCCAHLPPH